MKNVHGDIFFDLKYDVKKYRSAHKPQTSSKRIAFVFRFQQFGLIILVAGILIIIFIIILNANVRD